MTGHSFTAETLVNRLRASGHRSRYVPLNGTEGMRAWLDTLADAGYLDHDTDGRYTVTRRGQLYFQPFGELLADDKAAAA